MAQSEDRYVFIHTFSGKKHITEYANLNILEESLSSNEFFRISRGAIVNIRSIASVRKYFKGRLKVSVKTGDGAFDMVVSAARRDAFLNWLGGAEQVS